MVRVKRIIKISLIVVAVLILLPVLFVLIVSTFYTDEVKKMMLDELNKNIRTQISAKEISISLISKFPDASLVFSDIVVFSPKDFKDGDFPKLNTDTLLKAENVYLRFNILDVLRGKYTIKAIEVHEGKGLVLNDREGNGNYEFWKTDSLSEESPVRVRLQWITLKNIDIRYRNAAKDMKLDCSTEKFGISGSFFDESYSVSTSGGISLTRLSIGKTQYISKPAFITAEFDFDESKYNITSGNIQTGKLSIDLSGIFVVDPEFNCDISLKGNDIDIESFISLLPDSAQANLEGFSSSGNFYFEGKIEGVVSLDKSPLISLQFGVTNASIDHSSGITIDNFRCRGKYSNGSSHTLATSFLRLDSIYAEMPNSDFSGSYMIENFENPKVEFMLKGAFDLAEIRQLIGGDSVADMTGLAEVDIRFSGKMKAPGEFTKEDYMNGKTQGIISIKNVNVQEFGEDYSYSDMDGEFRFLQNDLQIDSLSLFYRNHQFKLKGSFRNLAGYILNDENMTVDVALKCGEFDFKKFYGTSTTSEGGFAIPGKMKLSADIIMESFNYDSFRATDISGSVVIENNVLTARGVTFNSCSGGVEADGVLSILPSGNIQAEVSAKFNSLQIKELFKSFDNFGQDFIMDKHLSGRITADLNMKSEWDTKISLVEDKLLANSHIIIEKGELIKFEPMMELSKFIAVSDLMYIKFEKMESDIAIKNRIIYIPNTEINSSAFNIEISGEHTFDNHINYRLRVLLSELLAGKARQQKKEIDEFGEVEPDGLHRTRLFLLVSGTTDDYKITYDTKGVKENIKESLKNEKETIKELLKEEFGGIFGKDTTKKSTTVPPDNKNKDKSKTQGVEIEW